MNESRPNEPLGSLLSRWKVSPPRNPAFRTEVWARIGKPPTLSWGAYARQHAPSVAGVILLAVAVGAVTGREQARARSERESARLAAAYVQGLDARSMTMP